MTKNVTISLPDELGLAMGKFQEVNWSAVCRDSIETYVKLREKPDLADTIQQLIKERGSEYAKGVESARLVANLHGNPAIDIIVRDYLRRYWEEAEKAYKEDTENNYERVGDVTFTDEFLSNLMFQAWKKYDAKIYEHSDAFMDGFRVTILEIHGLVRKGAK